jgi:hypothetical protein
MDVSNDRRLPSFVFAAARKEAAPLHQQFGQVRDGVPMRRASSDVRWLWPNDHFCKVVPAVHGGEPEAVGIADIEARTGRSMRQGGGSRRLWSPDSKGGNEKIARSFGGLERKFGCRQWLSLAASCSRFIQVADLARFFKKRF